MPERSGGGSGGGSTDARHVDVRGGYVAGLGAVPPVMPRPGYPVTTAVAPAALKARSWLCTAVLRCGCALRLCTAVLCCECALQSYAVGVHCGCALWVCIVAVLP